MLDLTGILFSSVMMLFVIIRAVVLDRTLPWFETVKRREDVTERKPLKWRRRN